MTRPNYIRADTIDLQDPDAPSAKDHTRQPVRPMALGEGPPAPHQADALKHVELEISEQHGRSPRASQDLSGKELQLLHDEADQYGNHDPSENLLRNSTQHASQEDMDEGDGDDGLDDDMADKISSSPSINDDGGYPIPYLPWHSRIASLRSASTPEKKATHLPGPPSDISSSPFSETPEHFPLSYPREQQQDTPSKDHHQKGEYSMSRRTRKPRTSLVVDEYEAEKLDRLSPLISERREIESEDEFADAQEAYEESFDPNDFHHLLAPEDDPLLDNSFDDAPLGPLDQASASDSSSPASKASWTTENMEGPDDDDTDDISFVDDSRFIDSGWGGECLREIEDIDFEFVYALHTFVATVEGQANATKGDTMVLLDDSNSYWWLVRVVKDSSIGYLPAEHIETPLERLARLNKHRNLDLSQTMLGDQDEDKRQNPLNPLKKAMRRRNVKKVEFAGNSYVEPSDVEYSSDEEEEDNGEFGVQEQNESEEQRQDHATDAEETVAVAPLSTRDRPVNGRRLDTESTEPDPGNGIDQTNGAEQARDSDEIFDRNDDGTATKSRKGTVRNTDSFFKDDSVETRKINLTPSLLRDDSNGVSPRASESSELKNRVSLDSLEKDPPPEKIKDEKKKKEKRGMLGGMFKRKDKKSKGHDKDVEDSDKVSSELSRKSPTPKESMESLDAQAARSAPQPHRQTSKLQKQPPAKLSPKSSYSTQSQAQNVTQRSALGEQQFVPAAEPDRGPTGPSDPNSSMRLVLPESQPLYHDNPSPLQLNNAETSREERPRMEPTRPTQLPKDEGNSTFSPFLNSLKPDPSELKSDKPSVSQERMRMDDFDTSSSSSAELGTDPSPTRDLQDEPEREPYAQPTEHHMAVAQAAQHEQHPNATRSGPSETTDRLSESPIQVSYPAAQERPTPHQPPPLITDTSSQSQADSSSSPVSSISSPEIIEAPTTHLTTPAHPTNIDANTPTRQLGQDTPSASPATQPSTRTTNTTTRSTPTWSDASLRAYMEDDSEIRDLLIVVNDKTGVVPRKDHPVVQGLFRDENQKLGEIEKKLDGLLGDFLGRRSQRVR